MSRYRVRAIQTVAELQSLAKSWEDLAEGVPFREPTWLLTWWKHFGDGEWGRPARRLFSAVVEDGKRLVAVAPWYIEWTTWGGSVVRPLGTGAVCSDHLTVVCRRGEEPEAAALLADHLCRTAHDEWDRFDFDGASFGDRALAYFFQAFEACGAHVERRPGVNCWRIGLPDTWEGYLAMLSKSHRKQLRRIAAHAVETPRFVWRTTTRAEELERDWATFVELHQRRRTSLGELGCFADPNFTGFHDEVARRFLERGRLQLNCLEFDGRPIAAEYNLVGRNVLYAYQSGLEPDALEHEPGRMAAVCVIRNAIAAGFKHYDLLRGDEAYKAHWRAKPFPTQNISFAAPRRASRWRFVLRQQARKLHAAFRSNVPTSDSQPDLELAEVQPATSV